MATAPTCSPPGKLRSTCSARSTDVAQIYDQEIRAGRQLIDTPLINPQDSRMVPNTFEAATLVSLPDASRFYDYALGYIWNVKKNGSNDFVSMSDAISGQDVINNGMPFGMIRVRPFAGLSFVAMDYYLRDFVSTGFAQVEYDFRQPKTVPNYIVGANVIEQHSVGEGLLNNGAATYQASAKAQMVYAGWTLFAAGSATGSESKIFNAFGSKPNYTDMQQLSFDLANEKAIGGSVAYDFGPVLGVNGLSLGVWYTKGWGAIDPVASMPIPDRSEVDLWVQYRPTEGFLKGFRFKTQYSVAHQLGNVRADQPEFRFIVDYTTLFRPPIAN